MKQISINWIHTYKADNREQALIALELAKKQEAEKIIKLKKPVKK